MVSMCCNIHLLIIMRTKQTDQEKEYTKASNPYKDESIFANQLFRSVRFTLYPRENGLIQKKGENTFVGIDKRTNARIQISGSKEDESSLFCLLRKSVRIPFVNRVYKDVKVDCTK